jgi:hypothetical protein
MSDLVPEGTDGQEILRRSRARQWPRPEAPTATCDIELADE